MMEHYSLVLCGKKNLEWKKEEIGRLQEDEFYLTPEFYEKELRIVGSSDGLDYKKHASWFLEYVKNTPFVSQLFEHEVTHQQLIRCFQELSEEKIKPIKVLIKYGD